MDIEHIDRTPEQLPTILRVLDYILLRRVARDEAAFGLGVEGEVLSGAGLAEQLLAGAVEGGGVDVRAAAGLEDGEEFGELGGGGVGAAVVDAACAEDGGKAGHCGWRLVVFVLEEDSKQSRKAKRDIEGKKRKVDQQ